MTTDARDARGPIDEGIREIQLNGKQLVFLFMATTVVSVVIFLCGVLVGRGVRAAENDVARAGSTAVGEASPDGTTAVPGDAKDAAPSAAGPNAQATGDAAANSDYYKMLTGDQPPAENVTPVDETPASPPPAEPVAAAPVKRPAPETATEKRPAPTTSRPLPPQPAAVATSAGAASSGGYVVQVTALRQRDEAQRIVDRLSGKGYKAFVLEPQADSTKLYRVRVGPFAEKGEADRAVKRLAQEGQFKPWVVR